MTKFSFTTMGTPELSGYEAIAAAQEYGYQGVDFRVHQKKGELQVDDSDVTIGDLRQCAEDANISVPSLLCYNATGNKDDPQSWQRMTDSIRRHMDIAHCLGAESIRIFGGAIHEYRSPQAFMEKTAVVLQTVLEADDSDLRIVLQNHLGSYTFMQGVALKALCGNDRFAMVYSPDHSLLMDEDATAVQAAVRESSSQMYLSDVEMHADGTHNGCLPGMGAVDFQAAYDAIGGADFSGWMSFKWEKIWQKALPEPEIALPHFLEYMRTHIV